MVKIAQLVGGVVLLCLGPSWQASAQSRNVTAVGTPPANHDQAKSARKPTRVSKVARAGSDRPAGQDNWTLNDALPKDSKAAVSIESPASSGTEYGRMKLDTGSIGISTSTLVKEGEFSDGRRVPGLEAQKRDAPTYFGLSLSVPTDKSIFPGALLPRGE